MKIVANILLLSMLLCAVGLADNALSVDVSALMTAPNLNYAYDGATGEALVTPLTDLTTLTVDGICLYLELKVINLSDPSCLLQFIAYLPQSGAGYTGFTATVDGATYSGAITTSIVSSPFGAGMVSRAEIPLDGIGVNMAADIANGTDVTITFSGAEGSVSLSSSEAQKAAISTVLEAYNVSGAWSDKSTLDLVAQRSPISLNGRANAVHTPVPMQSVEVFDPNDPLLAPVQEGFVDAWAGYVDEDDPLAAQPAIAAPPITPTPRVTPQPATGDELFVSAPAPFAVDTPLLQVASLGPDVPQGFDREKYRNIALTTPTPLPAPKRSGDALYSAVLDALNNKLFSATFEYLKEGNTLKSGSSGDAARGLQTIINKLGQTISTDGNMGPRTIAALNVVQNTLGLKEVQEVTAEDFNDLMIYALLYNDPNAAFAILPDQYTGTDRSDPHATFSNVVSKDNTITGTVIFNRPMLKAMINLEFGTPEADFTTGDLIKISPILPDKPYAFSMTVKNAMDVFVLRGTYSTDGGWIVREGTKMAYSSVKDMIVNQQFTIVAQTEEDEFGRYTLELK